MAVNKNLMIALALVSSLLSLKFAMSSHFRGASLIWKPANASSTRDRRVIISFRIAWRRSFSSYTYCDQSTINSGNLIGPGGLLTCRSGCSGSVSSMNFKCTDFSMQEDWSAGGRTYTYTFPDIHPPLYQASFTGYAWISLVTGGGGWEVRMFVNLTKRNDTGLINTSPTTAMSPIVRLQYGCNHTLVIPVSDADKDDIRCRWAESSKYECAGVCRTFPGAILDERKCQITYSGTGRTGWYAVAIMVEDFTDRLSRKALSSIPLQFLVQVFTSSAKCTNKPEFSRETRVDGSCIGVPHGSTFNERIIAKSHGAGNSVLEIKTISPSGLIKSSLAQYSANEWYVNVTWTPSRSQVDPVIFCYTAIDYNGLSSDQSCLTLLAGVAPPYMVNGSHSPTGLIYPNHQQWTIKFDKEFIRPKRSRYIRIFRADGTEVQSIDVSFSNNVIYPAGSLGRTLEFRPSFNFIEKNTYYVLLDPGIVQGTKFCGPVRDPYFWRVKIRDVTPPTVTFTSAPSVTNNATRITWRVDEPVSSLCTVTSPIKTTVFACNGSWVGSGLAEGYYRISVTATDVAGNIARPVLHSWNVDLTPPEPYLTRKPQSVSKQTSSRFEYRCRRDSPCYYECSLSQEGVSSTYSPCYESGYTARNLVNDVVYVFRLKARDQVGNQAQVLMYKWRIDTKPPTILNVKPLSVSCTSNLNPSSIGKPSATDNEDSNPKMMYQDSALPFGCGVRRIWTATDRAGNIATATQTITINGSLAPIINYDDGIVVACQTLMRMDNDIKKTINVTHPCGIPTNISYSDSKDVMNCGSPLVRTWTAMDNCGHSTTVIQNIKILALQLPDYPKSGQVNVNLNQNLNWPQYPGAVRYKVYIWKSTASKPSTPTATTTSRVFYSSRGQFPHGTQMLWQIEYVRDSGEIIPSPVWGFVTRHYPDFQIDSISVPLNAFSGQTVSVSWTVRNIGGISNTALRWTDNIYLGRTTSFGQSRWMSSVNQERLLAPNDAYVGRATIQLRDDDIGVYYVFVVTDARSQIQDIDRSNNIKRTSSSLNVALTPPPNLKVESIVLPPTTYSGQSITVKWSVANQGVGITGNSRWFDQLFLSKNEILDNDIYLGSKVHNGYLSVRQTYTQTMSVNIPHAIYGDFHVIVMTDSTNAVFENTGENDNVLASKSTIKVILTPPPDLIISSLYVQSSAFSSGSTVNIAYSVTNQGLGTPFHNWWNDQVSIVNLETKAKIVISTPSFSGDFPVGTSYSRKVSFVVLPNLKTGIYSLSVSTDVYNKVFEFRYENNNVKEMNITIRQSLPDLIVKDVQGLVISDPMATYLQINYTVVNRGKGKSYGAPWVDRMFLMTTTSFSLNNAKSLGDITRQTNVPPDGTYSVLNGKFKLKRNIFGPRYVFVVADAYSTILEEDESNNNGRSGAITIPRMFPDLAVQMVHVPSGSYFYAGTSIKVFWRVRNDGSGSTLDNSWLDMLYLSKLASMGLSAIKIYEVKVSPRVFPGHFYNYTAMMSLPENIYGEYFLIIKVNGDNSLAETDFNTNNIGYTRITLERMPQPDLKIVSVKYQYETLGNLLEVQWRVKNIGHSMTETNNWIDRIVLSQSDLQVTGSGVQTLGSKDVTATLSTQQEYRASATFSVPSRISGPMYVHVIVNYQGKLRESTRDQDNIGHATTPVPLKEPQSPILEVKIQTRLSTNLTCEKPFPFAFEVHNKGEGDANSNSWTDAVFVYYKRGSSLQEITDYGKRLISRIHTGGLRVNVSYTMNATITVPCLGMSDVYLYAFSDIHNRVGWKSPPRVFSKSIRLLTGPLPDLHGDFVNSSLQIQGGSPFKVYFKISNIGVGSTRGSWYNALYLSQDVLKDPFDLKLGSQNTESSRLIGNTSAFFEAVLFMPFDTVGSNYYLLLEVDSGNVIYESNEDNNMAYYLVKIQPTIKTDILVSSVSTAAATLSLGSDIKVDWTLRNNGTELAKGYKCDSVYLSHDEVWQIEDMEVAQPKCEFTSLLPYNSGLNRDKAFSLQKPLPLVAQGQYRGLVKSRSNIRDPSPNNNVKAGPRNINVTFPTLNLGGCVEADSGTSVYIINNVPSEMTLIVTARVSVITSFQDLYLRHNKPASSYHYDGKSKFAMSAKQDALVTSTKKGSYYVMLQRNDQAPAPGVKSKVCAKLAQFEILNIFPTTFAPLGNVTLRIEGTLFGWKLEVYLITKKEGIKIKAKRVYRFSSTLLYATFDVQEINEGTKFHCNIRDTSKNASATFNDSVTVSEGIAGKITVSVSQPKAVRVLDTSDITISYQNIGDTDLPSPVILFSSNERALLRYLQDGRLPSSNDKFHVVLAQPLEGPGGILPPRSSGRLRFQARHLTGSGTGRSELNVRSLIANDEPHLYMTRKDELKPNSLSNDLWDPVWRNFLTSVGTTQKSFSRRLSSVATQMSLDGKQVHMVNDLVKFQLDFANGVQSGDKLIEIVDESDQSSSSLLTLRMERIYSPFLTRRRDKGIFGTGWIAPWWETSIRFMNDSVINILHMRDDIGFNFVKSGFFAADGSQTIEIKDNEIIINGVASDRSEQFVFDLQNKRLKGIRGVNTLNESINVTAYTADNKPRRLEHSAGGSITVDFNSRGFVRKFTLIQSNGERSVGLYEYNQDLPLLASVTSRDRTLRYSYASNHDLESVTYPYKAKLLYSYNPSTSFIEKIVGLTAEGQKSKAVEFQYDWDGLVKVINLVDNSSTTFAFDETMTISSITGSDGIPFRTRTTMSEGTVVKRLIHGDQVVEKETLNAKKKTLQVEDANGDKIEFLLEDNSSPRNITDAAGNVFSFSYDNTTTFLSESTFPDGTKESFSYDARGNLDKRTTRNGRNIIFEHGADGKLVKMSMPDVAPTYYLHDSRGNIIMATNSEGTITLRYNRDNRPTSVTYPDGRNLEYKYNNIGQRIGLSENSTGYNVTYHYDNYNRLSEVRTTGPDGSHELLKVQYDSDGKLLKKTLGNNGSSEYTYISGTKRLKKLVNYSPFGNISSSFEYDYDDKGRAVQITSNEGIRLFKYDAASQLVGWTDVLKNGSRYKHTYEYDSRKNRVFSTRDGHRDNYETNSVNQYKSFGDYEFLYDKNGNMLYKKNKKSRAKDVKYIFSEENVMLQAETANERCNYIYDSLGNLYKKCTSGETRYVMDPFGILGSNLIAQISGGAPTLFVHTDEEGLLARLDVNGTAAYYEFSGEGNVIGLIDHRGNVLNSYRYGPFGNILYMTESVSNDFLFVGQWGVMRDKGIPYLYRMRSRHYDAQIGRFVSYDPLGYRTLNTNLYHYSYNNPILLKDPQGHLPVILVGALIGAAANTGAYLIGQWAVGEKVTLGGLVGAGFTGAVTGAVGGSLLTVGAATFAANMAGYAIQQKIDKEPFDGKKMLQQSSLNAATSWIKPFKAAKGSLRSQATADFSNGLPVSTGNNILLAWVKVYENLKNEAENHKIAENIEKIKENVKAIAENVKKNEVERFNKIAEDLKKYAEKYNVTENVEKIAENITKIAENVKKIAEDLKKNAEKLNITENVKKIEENVTKIAENVKKIAENVKENEVEKVKKIAEDLKKSAENVKKNAVQKFRELAEDLNRTAENLKQTAEGKLNGTANDLKKIVEMKKAVKLDNMIKNVFNVFIDWLISHDPNDILGPTGFGDARFIAEDTVLDYKIRFENDPNATAPAQRVVIRSKLDEDLDPRTFSIGSFGFGNFTKEQAPTPFLQEKLDLVDDRNILLRVVAGIDIVRNEAIWDLQGLDPKTGEPPRDPRSGFLPPNNGTTGQGFVTFSVRVKNGVKPLTRIDAKASIIFDRNEAIDTPPIFNTIDNSKPTVNLTVLQDVLKRGSLAVTLDKEDIGTGIQSVDIYYQEAQGDLRLHNASRFKQLLTDITEDTVILPLAPGKSYKLVTSSVDHVGNRQDMKFGQSIFADFREIKSSCSHLNNCSNHGNCSVFSFCVCEQGYYGINCSQDQPPLEPPVLEASSSGGVEDTPIPIFLSAHVFGTNVTNDVTLSITIYGVPDSFVFSRGMRSKGTVTLQKQQFGALFITPAKDVSGNFTLDIVAKVARDSEQSETKSSFTIIVKAKADAPTLITEDACANSSGIIPLSIRSWLNDKDDSEKLTIALSGLPNGYQLSEQGRLVNGTHYVEPASLTGLVVRYDGVLEPFVLKTVATSVEKSNGDTASVMDIINVTSCIVQFTCEKVKNCLGHGVCVGADKCKCDEAYTGPACAEVVVDTQTVTNVTVKEGEDVRINCSNNAQGEGQWKKDGSDVDLSNRIRIVDTILIITNSSMDDAGVYKCLKGKNTHIVNLRVNVTVKVMMSLRILNWNFTNEIQDKKSAEYMRFEDNFKKQMDELYKDLKGYIGVEILEILNGSVRVVFRVIVTQSISDRKETTTYKRVVITQKVIDEAKTGWVKNLQVDASPEAFKTDAPPPQPENVTLVDVTDSGAEISWDKPKNHGYYDIKGYLIEYWLFSSPNNKENLGIIKGEKTKITGLKDETAYVARIFAMNDNKGQESAAIDIKTEKAVLAGWVIALIVILCILILLIIIALIIFLCRRRKMQREKMEEDLFAMQNVNRNKVEETEKGHPILRSYTNNMYNLSNDNWTEIPRENLVLLEKIGSGEFGVVHKGQLVKDGNPTVCAVKTHKAGAGPEEYRALYEELEIMANVGNHPNLVNLIGATSKEDELFVIVEFARYGSLVKFLRSQRLKPEEKYEFDLNYMNRLRIALDVAKGMAYLQSKRCVHRDLAARNVLLADNFVAKVADFGLSRDIYETGEYEKTTRGKMPTRWMAIESLELMRFTLKSDVWSYGVLLWEIETKGLMPHGAIAYIELLEKQKKGYRLEQPNGTPDELYGLMQKCWQANPQDRPNFPEICDTLETALLKSAPDY